MARKRKKIGKRKFFGYGGGRKGFETLHRCAAREFEEEAQVKLDESRLEFFAHIKYFNGSDKNPFAVNASADFEVWWARYRAPEAFFGQPEDNPEMYEHTWFALHDIPWDNPEDMAAGDALVLPPVLCGVTIQGWVWQNQDLSQLLGHKIDRCSFLPSFP